jgi:hypothetical protein
VPRCCRNQRPDAAGTSAQIDRNTHTVAELIAVSGHIALQIKDLPDGARVELKVVV